jgi:uncharacterized protein
MSYMLYASAGAGDVDGIRDALDNGAQIDSHGTAECWTALMCAARNGHINAVRYLIDRGANPNWHGWSDNETALSVARRNGMEEVARFLAPLTAPDGPQNPFCFRPLFEAIRRKDINAVKQMLDTKTMVLYDAKAESYKTVPLPDGEINSLQIDFAQTWIRTPLLQAWNENHDEMIKLLVEKGADVNWQDASGDTILSCVARDNKVELVQYLLRHGARYDFKMVDGRWFLEHPLPVQMCQFFRTLINH